MNDIWDKLKMATGGNFSGEIRIVVVEGVPAEVTLELSEDIEWESAQGVRTQLAAAWGGAAIYGPLVN